MGTYKKIHNIDDDDGLIKKVSGGNKKNLHDFEYDEFSIDKLGEEHPDLAAQCRQFLPRGKDF